MKLAILDLGTNTFHLLIADVYNDNSYKIIFKTRAVVKLGSGGINNRLIAPEPFRRGIEALKRFKRWIKKYKAEQVFAFATSALRSSKNGSDFVAEAKSTTGIQIKIISGNEEARLIYYGVRQCVNIGNEPVLMMDIGGGSTEFIIADAKKIYWKHSFDIGVARLLERFNPSDPVTNKEIKMVEKYLGEKLNPLHEAIRKYPVKKLIGCSGSFDTLAEIIGHRFYNRNIVKGKSAFQFDLSEYKTVYQWLIHSTRVNRMQTKGLIRMRVDMIVLAVICTNYVINKFHLKEIFLSKYALKEGALWKVIQNK